MDSYLARFAILHHRSATVNNLTPNPSLQAYMLMNGLGMDARAQLQCLQTLNGRLPTDEAQLQHVMIQRRRYGHLAEQSDGAPHRLPQHFATTTGDANDGGAFMGGSATVGGNMGLRAAMSPLIGGSGGTASASTVAVAPVAGISQDYPVNDDSDTSDEGSDGKSITIPIRTNLTQT